MKLLYIILIILDIIDVLIAVYYAYNREYEKAMMSMVCACMCSVGGLCLEVYGIRL